MSIRSAVERHRLHAERRRTERALVEAMARATGPSEVRDLRSLANR